jgi:hypothetical protein
MTGRKTKQQGAEVEGAAYAETVRMIDRFCCDAAGYVYLCGQRSRSGEVIRSFQALDRNLIIISPQSFLCSAPVGVTIRERQAHDAANLAELNKKRLAQLVAAFLHDSDSREDASGRRHV